MDRWQGQVKELRKARSRRNKKETWDQDAVTTINDLRDTKAAESKVKIACRSPSLSNKRVCKPVVGFQPWEAYVG